MARKKLDFRRKHSRYVPQNCPKCGQFRSFFLVSHPCKGYQHANVYWHCKKCGVLSQKIGTTLSGTVRSKDIWTAKA